MSSTVFFDTFTSSAGSGIAISAHTPDVGTGWTAVDTATATIVLDSTTGSAKANPAGVASTRVTYLATPNPALGSADYDVSVKVTAFGGGAVDNDDPLCLIARQTDTSNFYFAQVYYGTGGLAGHILINKVVNSTLTDGLANSTFTPSTGDVLTFSLAGSTLVVLQNGVQRAQAVDASLTSIGSPGLSFGNLRLGTDDVSGVMTVDDFLVVDQTSTGGATGGATVRLSRRMLMGTGW